MEFEREALTPHEFIPPSPPPSLKESSFCLGFASPLYKAPVML